MKSEAVVPLVGEDPDQFAVPCLLMRGGSSRGGVFLERELPSDQVERAALLLAIYGSPDMRQINGIGGADPLTSKAAIVDISERDDADLNYTFCQISIDEPRVSTGGNCGNMLAAVAPFAVLRGLIKTTDGEMSVRVYTKNTGQVSTVRMTVRQGMPAVLGQATVAGVPGTGSPITIDFGNCGGALSGKLLPTGAVRDVVRLGDKEVAVSLVDAATPFVFVDAGALGASGTETPAEIGANLALMERLEQIRGWAATALGLLDDPSKAAKVVPNVPRVIMVAPPKSYIAPAGPINADDYDVCVRQLAMQTPHKTVAVTGAVCTAVAASLSGTVVAEAVGATRRRLRLGHPAGVLTVSAAVKQQYGQYQVVSAAVERTARLISAGYVYADRDSVQRLSKVVRL